MTTLTTVLTILMALFAIFLFLKYRKKSNLLENEIKSLNRLLKSQQVKFGKSFEHFVPLANNFPANKENTVFLGMPIDYIAFEDNCIRFIEVKTGKSQLSPKQRKIRDLIKNKKVEWRELIYDR